MVATLQLRKEALVAKIQEKNEELKRLCLQEADLTGVVPPEIPLEPGEPLPQVRRRVGTSFSFPQNLINSMKGTGDEALTELELECKVQTNIAEAALSLANDTTANKSARRKHRLMYRQSQRRLMELETRLTLLRQGKSQQVKPQQAKKKPRPNTTAVDLGFMWNRSQEVASQPGCSTDDVDSGQELAAFRHRSMGSLHRSLRSSASQSSSSSRIDVDFAEEHRATLNTSGLPQSLLQISLSHPNIQGEVRGSPKKLQTKRQWDSQSVGGTLLPNQTYPDHSHQPNLSRTQSLGSMEHNTQRSKDTWSVQEAGSEPKEKEWYETSLDSAPSPPIRTSSRLPAAARIMYQMQEAQNSKVLYHNHHPALTRTHHHMPQRSLDGEDVMTAMQHMYLNTTPRMRTNSVYLEDTSTRHSADPRIFHWRDITETHFDQPDPTEHSKLYQKPRLYGLPPVKDHVEHKHVTSPSRSDSVYIYIPEENSEVVTRWIHEKPKTEPEPVAQLKTPPYYHGNRPEEPVQVEGDTSMVHHPAHAITHSEITFDTIVPFESPQNHTVVQAGKWQPYREVSKPFEMADFYKYSTKFRQQNTSSPSPAQMALHHKGIYQPLKPMTCQPVESRSGIMDSQLDGKQLAQVSHPEIV